MKKIIAALLLLSFVAKAQEIKAIKCGKLLDVKSGKYIENAIIIIKGNKIEAVGKNIKIPKGAKVIDLSDKFVLPGLIDSHTHILLQGDVTMAEYEEQILKESIPYRTIRAVKSVETALMHGFTTLRDVGTEGAYYADVDVKKAINKGIIPGPRLFVSTRALDVTGAYPLLGYSWEIRVPKGVQVVDGVDECIKAVREEIKYGADWIKVYCDRSYYIGKDGKLHSIPTFRMEELKAIVSEAHRLGKKVAAHAIGLEGIKNAIEAGVNSIEHGIGFDEETLELAKKKNIYWCPTLYVLIYVSKGRASSGNKVWLKMVDIHKKAFQLALKKGVKIALGSDVGGFHWTVNQVKEIEYMVKYGMKPIDAIRSATLIGAELLGVKDKIGSIEKGKLADIIAVDSDPLENISALENVTFVMKDGKIYKAP